MRVIWYVDNNKKKKKLQATTRNMLYLIQDINGDVTFPPHIWKMVKDYAGIYDISTSWKKLKTLPLVTFRSYSLNSYDSRENDVILENKKIKPNKRKIMVLKSWTFKQEQSFWKGLLKEVDDRVAKKNQHDQKLNDYMKPYKNAKYIVINRADENMQLCFGIVKVTKITRTKIVGNLIEGNRKNKLLITGNRYLAIRETNYIDSITIGDEINADYKLLLDDYIKPMLIWYTQSEVIPFLNFSVSNGGVFKNVPEGTTAMTQEELSYMMRKINDTAEFYTRRFVDYMSYNSTLYPEYTGNQDEDMYPERDYNFTGWVL